MAKYTVSLVQCPELKTSHLRMLEERSRIEIHHRNSALIVIGLPLSTLRRVREGSTERMAHRRYVGSLLSDGGTVYYLCVCSGCILLRKKTGVVAPVNNKVGQL